MNSNLKIMDLCENCDTSKAEKFIQKIDSNVELKLDYDKIKNNNEWVDIINDTIPYIQNALDKPNRVLNNNEEILQIEKTKKVTVDSIKHLTKHTNLIQDIDKDDNVLPLKVLNVLKEESFATYENRFIYTLILKMNMYIRKRKEKIIDQGEQAYKEDKTMQYTGNTVIGKEKVGINIAINSSLNTKAGEAKNDDNKEILDVIEKLEKKMLDLMNTSTYKIFEKSRFLLITPPLKMTNALLKNPNLQCAVKLWNFLIASMEENGERIKNTEIIKDNKNLKNFIDESFFLDYLILNSFDQKGKIKNEEKYIEILLENILNKALSINSNISEEQINKIINKKYRVIKNKIIIRNTEIENIFKESINKYITKISKIKI